MRRALPILGLTLALVACDGVSNTPVNVPELSDTYGCGHGFWVGSASQEVGLFVESGTGFGEDVGTGSYSMPDQWTAELRFGDDLFANWCDDVIEPGEPEPKVRSVWLVSGELALIAVPTAGECGPASARLTNAVAVDADGNELPLDDMDLENPDWGCFAG